MTELPRLERPLSDSAESSYTLSSEYYLSAQIFELEKQRIFYTTWQYVAPAGLLANAGDYATLRICDENVFVIRSADGELRAFYNVCRHRAHELLEGRGNVRNLIVCPYHAWSYRNDGQLAQAPMSEHRSAFDKAEFCLRAVRLEIFCGLVFVNLDDHCESLQALAGDLERDLRDHLPWFDALLPDPVNLFENPPIRAGWKVVVDNYVECYHCRPAHPDFASIIDMDSYQTDVYPLWSRQYGSEVREHNSAYPLEPGSGYRHSVFWYLWPNTTFNVLPGPEALNVSTIRPIDAGNCYFDGDTLTTGAKPDQARSDYLNEVLTPEDIGLCESVQRGLRSRSYDQGAYMVDPARPGESEHALHHFHRLVQSSLVAD